MHASKGGSLRVSKMKQVPSLISLLIGRCGELSGSHETHSLINEVRRGEGRGESVDHTVRHIRNVCFTHVCDAAAVQWFS